MNEKEITMVEALKKKYADKEETVNKLEELKALDRKVRRVPEIFAYTFGVLSALVFGVGLCMCLEAVAGGMVLGCVIGAIGAILSGINYLIYRAMLSSRKKKFGGRILALSEEILGEGNL